MFSGGRLVLAACHKTLYGQESAVTVSLPLAQNENSLVFSPRRGTATRFARRSLETNSWNHAGDELEALDLRRQPQSASEPVILDGGKDDSALKFNEKAANFSDISPGESGVLLYETRSAKNDAQEKDWRQERTDDVRFPSGEVVGVQSVEFETQRAGGMAFKLFRTRRMPKTAGNTMMSGVSRRHFPPQLPAPSSARHFCSSFFFFFSVLASFFRYLRGLHASFFLSFFLSLGG